jgi:hypothetical protein
MVDIEDFKVLQVNEHIAGARVSEIRIFGI